MAPGIENKRGIGFLPLSGSNSIMAREGRGTSSNFQLIASEKETT